MFLSFVAPFTQEWKGVFFQTNVEKKESSSIINNHEVKHKDKEKKKEKAMSIPM